MKNKTYDFDRGTATGVISEEYGIDYSNYDAPCHIGISSTQIDKAVPTTRIRHGRETYELPTFERQLDLATISLVDPVSQESVLIEDFLTGRLKNQGLMVLHKGSVVHESYRGLFGPKDLHVNFSTTKSIVGMLTGVAIGADLLDPEAPIHTYVSELADKPVWKEVSVRHVMDMRDGIEFDEDYADKKSMFWRYVRSVEPFRTHVDDPKGFRQWLSQNLDVRRFPVGEIFQYSSVQSCILACALESVFEKTFDRVFEENLFRAVGPEFDAGFCHDGHGFHLADGLLNMTLRDFSRLALLALHRGRNLKGKQIIPEAFFDDLVTPNPTLKQAFRDHKERYPNGQYRSQFWVIDPERQQIAMTGIHGQFAYIDYRNELAIVGFSCYPVATDRIMRDSLKALWRALTIGTLE